MSQPGTTTDPADTGERPRRGSTLTAIGDVPFAEASSAAHAAYAELWTKGAALLDQGVDLQAWTGEAADAARAKLRGMRSLMEANATVLTEMSSANRTLAIEANELHADINREKAASDAVLAASGDASATPVGIIVQGFTNVGLKWVIGGALRTASMVVGDRFAAAMFRDTTRRNAVVTRRLATAAAFVAMSHVPGAISAAFFELGAFRDGNGPRFRTERGVTNTLLYAGVGGVATGLIELAKVYGRDRGWNEVRVASGIGGAAGATGGTLGPYAVALFPGTPVPFGGIVAASAVVNAAAGATPEFQTVLKFAASRLRAIAALMTPTRIVPPVPAITEPVGGGIYVTEDEPVVINIDDAASTSSDTSYQTASSTALEYYDAQEEAGDNPNG